MSSFERDNEIQSRELKSPGEIFAQIQTVMCNSVKLLEIRLFFFLSSDNAEYTIVSV